MFSSAGQGLLVEKVSDFIRQLTWGPFYPGYPYKLSRPSKSIGDPVEQDVRQAELGYTGRNWQMPSSGERLGAIGVAYRSHHFMSYMRWHTDFLLIFWLHFLNLLPRVK